MDFLAKLEKRSKLFWTAVGFAFIEGVGILDFLTGYEFSFSIFYWIPIATVTWFAGRRPGLVASMVSACVWFLTDLATGHAALPPIIYAWNTLIEFCSFTLVVLMLSALKTALEHERELARTDYLTGAANSRCFFDLVQMEVDRSERSKAPFTVAYIDIDNFKAINDRFGHTAGNEVLRAMVQQARRLLRKTDVIARLGGDEFALLLPGTSPEAAQTIVSKLQREITAGLQHMNWPVTFSMGVWTCVDSAPAPDEIVRIVDDLMYSVKQGSKNSIRYANPKAVEEDTSSHTAVEF